MKIVCRYFLSKIEAKRQSSVESILHMGKEWAIGQHASTGFLHAILSQQAWF
jgi:hypothetical protein